MGRGAEEGRSIRFVCLFGAGDGEERAGTWLGSWLRGIWRTFESGFEGLEFYLVGGEGVSRDFLVKVILR